MVCVEGDIDPWDHVLRTAAWLSHTWPPRGELPGLDPFGMDYLHVDILWVDLFCDVVPGSVYML